jgi:hypothetical protein
LISCSIWEAPILLVGHAPVPPPHHELVKLRAIANVFRSMTLLECCGSSLQHCAAAQRIGFVTPSDMLQGRQA